MGLGNIIGFPSKPPGSARPGINGGAANSQQGSVIRMVDWKKRRELSKRAQDIGVIKVYRKEAGKKLEREVIKRSNVVEFLQRGAKSGLRLSKYKAGFDKRNEMVDQQSGGKVKYIFSRDSGRDREKSQQARNIYDLKGETPKQIVEAENFKNKIIRLNVFNVNRSRTADDLKSGRLKGEKKSVDLRNKDNTAINASNIGVQAVEHAVTALGGSVTAKGQKNIESSFAGESRISDKEKQDNVVSLEKYKQAKAIDGHKQIPLSRTGTNG